MPTVAIELCDPGIALVRSREAPLESPGYALLRDGRPPTLGAQAYASSRLAPRFVHNRFWDQLGLQALPHPGSGIETLADLASAHLLDLWQQASRDASQADEALLVVPGCYGIDQLGVLLGVLEGASIPVAGMVDAAVAAAVSVAAAKRDGDTLHVDVLLHRTILSELELVDASWQLRDVHSHRQLGLASAGDSWAKFLAELFVRNTRFDPLHRAESEQGLYDLLPDLIAQSRTEARIPIEMQAGERSYRVTLESEHLAQSTRPQYQRLLAQIETLRGPGRPLRLLLSSRAGGMPGLAALLARMPDCEVVQLPAAAAGFSALAREAEIRSADGVVRMVKALRHLGEAASQRPAEPSSADKLPTHVLLGDRAYELGSGPLYFQAEASHGFTPAAPAKRPPASAHLSLFADDGALWIEAGALELLRNDRPVGGRERVHLGDRIRCVAGGDELRLIALVAGHGA